MKKSNLVKIATVILWILIFNWRGGFGLSVEWWVYVVVLGLWLGYVWFNKVGFLMLIPLFLINLYINHLFSFKGMDFNLEKINLTNPQYIKLIDRYRYDDVGMPYRLRMMFYQNWLNVFLWIDSTFKLMSPVFWLRVLGFGGFVLAALGIVKTKIKYWWWLLVVVASSGLGILVDTKTAVVLSLPVVVIILANGLDHKLVKKYWWIMGLLLMLDLILK